MLLILEVIHDPHGGKTSVKLIEIFLIFYLKFRFHITQWKELVEKYREKVDFLTVYISEAHPSDGWKMKTNSDMDVCYRQPKTLKSRINIAKSFVEREEFEDIPFVVDDITNEGADTYQSLPERIYIIENNRISYRGGLGPIGYKLYEVVGWVAQYCEANI